MKADNSLYGPISKRDAKLRSAPGAEPFYERRRRMILSGPMSEGMRH